MESTPTKEIQSEKNTKQMIPSSLEQGTIYLLQSLQSLQANQYLQQQQQHEYQHEQKKENKNIKKPNKLIASIYEGQSFPYRLWHLLNNEYFDDVIHWSENGNSIVIPKEDDFVVKVLKRTTQRIFKTESMKSFVRQLNLYGFHKVSLEKDDAFSYLRLRAKHNWPDAVFNHGCFKKERPDLLDHVKRRCRVKSLKENEKKNKDFAEELFNQLSPNHPLQANRKNPILFQYPQLVPGNTDMFNQYPNLIAQNEPPVIEASATKRKLQFMEDKDSQVRKPINPVLLQCSSPFYLCPQTYIGNNFQYSIHPPQGWINARNTIPHPVFSGGESVDVIQSPATSFVERNSSTCPPQENDTGPVRRFSGPNSQSPLAKFCAALFRPESLNSTPSKNCDVDIGDETATSFVDSDN